MINRTVWRQRFDRALPIIITAMLVFVGYAVIVTYSETKANARQDHQRIVDQGNAQAAQEKLLDCFDDFATALAGGLPPVRVASAARDNALEAALVALRDTLSEAVKGEVTPDDVAGLVRLFTAYEDAAAELDQVRADNPYPEAPSEFCS